MREFAFSSVTLPFRDLLFLGGAYCRFATNSAVLARHLASRWRATADAVRERSFDACLAVDDSLSTLSAPMHFRGVEQYVFAEFPQAHFCFDLQSRTVVGAASPAVAADRHFWDSVLLPIALGVLGPSLRVNPTHCAALSLNGTGVLIAGLSGAGKSTMTFALAQRGATVVSDDWSYILDGADGLVAYGLETPLKLLPDVARFFPQLRPFRPSPALNGELAYEIPGELVGLRVERSCRPGALLFLERWQRHGCQFERVAPEYARAFFEQSAERLPARMAGAIANRAALIERISRLECWRFLYGDAPGAGADAVVRFFQEARCKAV